ncbi:MAG: sulfatase-like hydrolase/transferase [Acidimicrobiales bacterium]
MSDEAPGRRPNVLFIITDQQRADHVGFAGNEIVQTPNLDALAARGTVFDSAWVANPVCMPNRSTIMTGRMPTAHGVIFNDRSLDWGANTFVRQFLAAGWRTALIGKSHLQHGLSRNAVVPIGSSGAFDDPWPPGWNTLEDHESFADGPPDFPPSFYGFEHVELSIDHGSRITGHHLQWALDRGGVYEQLVVPMTDEAPAKRRSDRWWQVYEPPYGPELHSTTFVAEQTSAFIEEAAAGGSPWLVMASFPDPHHPMTPPGEWFDRHDPADMPLSPSIADDLATAPDYLRRFQRTPPTKQRGWVGMCGATDHELMRECLAATYGSIEMIDDAVGRILATIDRLGQTDDTIVVFTSDHGDMMGDHGLMLKGYMPYRGTLQVPLVIVDPDRAPARTTSLAGSIDLGSTLLDLAGLEGYVGIQGSSLVPILDDPAATVRDHILIEDDLPAGLAALAPIPAKSRTLVTAQHKYTRFSSGEDLLFDLGNDPLELDDLSSRETSMRGHLIEHLADALMAVDDDARGAPINH